MERNAESIAAAIATAQGDYREFLIGMYAGCVGRHENGAVPYHEHPAYIRKKAEIEKVKCLSSSCSC